MATGHIHGAAAGEFLEDAIVLGAESEMDDRDRRSGERVDVTTTKPALMMAAIATALLPATWGIITANRSRAPDPAAWSQARMRSLPASTWESVIELPMT